ncbi:Anaphase-promoting complex subunit 8 [Spathaspora sp. JA1]|nr:Anaphase-promoting complex subunit 8 [Spathaspora sp. JA1]
MTDIDQLRTDLYKSCIKLTQLNLHQSSKWCAEALAGLVASTTPISIDTPPIIIDGEQQQMLLANSYFNCKEFDRAAYVLKSCVSGDATFLRLYSMVLAIDKRETESEEPNDSLAKVLVESNQYLAKSDHALLYYLNGLIYNKKKKYQLAQTNLYKSIKLFPYNWSCWQELITSFTSFEEANSFLNKLISSKILSSNIMVKFFEVVILQEFHQPTTTTLTTLNQLLQLFPKFSFIKIQQFLISYHNLDYYIAEHIFDEILIQDPLRLDDLHTFSNMLYVMEKRSKLTYLAHFANSIDKFRPETCCILANYHSMKSQHEMAIMYYKRALLLDKNCLSAYTLIGHEFVELKNSHAAIESYRKAIDLNNKDFRAWYGLGQAYEVLDMHLYALYYYQRATNLQNNDKRMWIALGGCFEKIEKFKEAIKSFEKALIISTDIIDEQHQLVDPHIAYRLAIICEKLGDVTNTEKYMKLCFNQEFEMGVSDDTCKARLWLARYALDQKNFNYAYELAKDLQHGNSHDIEEARGVAREARNRM